jgi:aerobic carbon-monoxide dehydrogenase large subunit
VTVIRPGSILGTRVRRVEDPELVTGQARFLADLDLPDALHALFVRSDVAHGRLIGVDTAAAAAMPGVVAVWTAEDVELAPHHGLAAVHDDFARPPLAVDRVRFVGEAVAVVLATSQRAAVDAAQYVEVQVDPLDEVADAEAALDHDAVALFAERGHNRAVVVIDDAEVDLEACSDLVVRGRYVNQRMAVVAMEPDACAARPESDGRLTVWVSNQMPHLVHQQLAKALGAPSSSIHVITPQVGGGFGGKAGLHPEYTVVAAAARRLNRAVRWIPTRSDDMVSMPQSRGQVQYVELGCRRDGTFTGLRVRLVGDSGAYPGIGAMLPTGTRRMGQGPYVIPAAQIDVVGGATNTTPMGAYRGAGRPEATAMLERAVDQAAHELGIDPIELRRRNFIQPNEFPYRTLFGHRYDSGDYEAALDRAAELVGYTEVRLEQRRRREAGERMLLGVGVASYVEVTAGGTANEYAAVEAHGDGTLTVYAGTAAHGQGHRTSYAMLVAEQTGVAMENIRLVDGDTDRVPRGGGTGGSRSLQLGGSAVRGATEVLVEQARQLAARHFEADIGDVVVNLEAATVGVAGVPSRALTWAEIADLASEADTELKGTFVFDQQGATFPFGSHMCVVEVDRDTGFVRVLRHVAVDDCGVVVNPLIVEGQQHGGLAAGIGQALFEEVRFGEAGTPNTATLMDYTVPTASDLPSFEVAGTQTPTPLNPLGVKGIGEASTIGATPAVQNAVIDALAHLGVRHIDMPCTPERVWNTLRRVEQQGFDDPWRPPPAVFDALRRASSEADRPDHAAVEQAEGV